MTAQIATALIVAVSALAGIVLKDAIFGTLSERRTQRRSFLEHQIERAYAPVEYLLVGLLEADGIKQKEVIYQQLRKILRLHSYLMSDRTVSALHLLLKEEETGMFLLEQHFYSEFEHVKQQYYKSWFVQRERTAPVVQFGPPYVEIGV